jgi:uncharacterized protein
MKQLTSFLKRYSLICGIVLMFLLTWPIDLANSGVLPLHFPFIVYLFLGWGFVFAALIMTGLTLGKTGVVTLLKRYLLWRVGWKWYLVAFLLAPAIFISAVWLNAALTQQPVDFSTIMAHKIFGSPANLAVFILPFFLVDLFSNGEEIGWRGYVLPRLQAKYSALTATLILGVIWSFWHLPKFLSHWNTLSFAWFTLQTMAFAVVLTWLYNNTRGSLLLTGLCHASANTAGLFLPMASTASGNNMNAYITIVLIEVVVAIAITVIAGPERLSRREPKQVQA